ncbi:uncharacterized protein METZ01_LOCUS7956 [marine metagenome]|uniref:Uncharacterized protein n=1 Tax=marine metagenome TaxID=408172 RepID=A0A381NKF7_9ZZZZ
MFLIVIANSWPILFYGRLTSRYNVYDFSDLRRRVKIFICVSLPVKFLALLKVFEGRPILSTGGTTLFFRGVETMSPETEANNLGAILD